MGAGLEPIDIWMERRVRHVPVEEYMERMRVVAGHIIGDPSDPQVAEWLAKVEAEMRRRAVDVYCWLLRLDDASGVEGGWADPAAPLPETVVALVRHCGDTYLPFLAANLGALQEGKEEVSVQIGGRPYAQAPFRYQAKCYDALRKKLAALPAEARRRLDPVLEETGCLKFLA